MALCIPNFTFSVLMYWEMIDFCLLNRASLVAQMVKNLPEIQATWVQSLGQENPLQKGLTTHFSILAGRMSWTEEPGGLQFMGLQRVGHN